MKLGIVIEVVCRGSRDTVNTLLVRLPLVELSAISLWNVVLAVKGVVRMGSWFKEISIVSNIRATSGGFSYLQQQKCLRNTRNHWCFQNLSLAFNHFSTWASLLFGCRKHVRLIFNINIHKLLYYMHNCPVIYFWSAHSANLVDCEHP